MMRKSLEHVFLSCLVVSFIGCVLNGLTSSRLTSSRTEEEHEVEEVATLRDLEVHKEHEEHEEEHEVEEVATLRKELEETLKEALNGATLRETLKAITLIGRMLIGHEVVKELAAGTLSKLDALKETLKVKTLEETLETLEKETLVTELQELEEGTLRKETLKETLKVTGPQEAFLEKFILLLEERILGTTTSTSKFRAALDALVLEKVVLFLEKLVLEKLIGTTLSTSERAALDALKTKQAYTPVKEKTLEENELREENETREETLFDNSQDESQHEATTQLATFDNTLRGGQRATVCWGAMCNNGGQQGRAVIAKNKEA